MATAAVKARVAELRDIAGDEAVAAASDGGVAARPTARRGRRHTRRLRRRRKGSSQDVLFAALADVRREEAAEMAAEMERWQKKMTAVTEDGSSSSPLRGRPAPRRRPAGDGCRRRQRPCASEESLELHLQRGDQTRACDDRRRRRWRRRWRPEPVAQPQPPRVERPWRRVARWRRWGRRATLRVTRPPVSRPASPPPPPPARSGSVSLHATPEHSPANLAPSPPDGPRGSIERGRGGGVALHERRCIGAFIQRRSSAESQAAVEAMAEAEGRGVAVADTAHG